MGSGQGYALGMDGPHGTSEWMGPGKAWALDALTWMVPGRALRGPRGGWALGMDVPWAGMDPRYGWGLVGPYEPS